MTALSATAPAVAASDETASREIFADQVRLLFRLSRAGYAGTLVNAFIIGLALLGHVPSVLVAAWLAAVMVVTGGRYVLYRRFVGTAVAPDAAPLWARRFTAGAVVMGVLWGLLGSALLPAEDMVRQFLIMFVLGGMVAGAVVVLTPVRRVFSAFALPALLPLVAAVFWHGTTLHLLMGLMILVYIAVMLGTQAVMHDIHVRALRTRFENASLVRQLAVANLEVAAANEELTGRLEQLGRAEEALRVSTDRLEALVAASPLAIIVLDTAGVVQRWNRAAERVFGWTEEEVRGTLAPHIPKERATEALTQRRTVLDGGTLAGVETVRRRKDGTRIHVRISAAAARDGRGETTAIILLIDDITERVRADRLRDLEHAVTRLLAGAHSVHDAMGQVLPAVCEATGCAYGGRWLVDAEDGRMRCAETWIDDAPELHEFIAVTAGMRRRPGESGGLVRQLFTAREPVWAEDVAAVPGLARRDAVLAAGLKSAFAFPILVAGEFYGAMEFFARDRRAPDPSLLRILGVLGSQIAQFIARKQAESHLRFFANHDALTGLPNRAMFTERLAQAVAQAQRHHRRGAVLFMDLDRFKIINDTLGHEAGDVLLKELAARLREALRAGDTIGRQGGDEFVVLVEDAESAESIAEVAQKILDTVSRTLPVHGHEYSVTASIGISVFPDDGADVQTLLKNADIAMYRAKERGRNAFEFWSGEMNVHSMERLALEGELRRALERDEFLLHFQPKVDLASGHIVGVESLVRWQRRDGRLVMPAEFIPLAEETGVIDALGEWVLRRACGELRSWRVTGMSAPRMAVNLSARQFARESLCATVAGVLAETGLEGSALELEITESMVMRDPERAARVLGELKALGVRVAIDDFGTGYSSLSYLKRFPIDHVKIDRAFIEGLPGDEDDVVITRAVIAMAHSLGLRVTAEGVETREQLEFLREQGCDEAQGYFLAMPEPADAIAGRILAGTLAAPARQH